MKRIFLLLTLIVSLTLPPQVDVNIADGVGCSFTIQAKNKSKKPHRGHRAAKRKQAKQAKTAARKARARQSASPVPLMGATAPAAMPADQQLLRVAVPTADCRTIAYKAISVSFDSRLRIPRCVAYTLTATQVAMADAPGAERRKNHHFAADPQVKASPGPGDYRGSGFSRGHMAPAMDMRFDHQAMAQCFLMTNMCPQDEKLNNGAWRQLEERVHRWARRDGQLVIFTGPVMPAGRPATVGPRADIAVPAAFYKVVYAPRQNRAIAFVYDNRPPAGGLERHVTTIADVERQTGLTFLSALPAQQQRALKQQCDLGAWQ